MHFPREGQIEGGTISEYQLVCCYIVLESSILQHEYVGMQVYLENVPPKF